MAQQSLARQECAARATPMSDKDFGRFAEFIQREVGIKLPPAKKTMLEARLQKRLRCLGMPSYAAYTQFLFSDEGLSSELVHLIDVVTTNTTDFFREPRHFDVLSSSILPELFARMGQSRPLSVWSAGCSIGMEPYTLAMVLEDYVERRQGAGYGILATDISTRALETARQAIYDAERVIPVPDAMKRKYLLRSKDRTKNLVRIVPELRRRVRFMRLNFMEDWGFRDQMDIIFCRNVVIYFDRPTQERLFSRFCGRLRPGGYLFIGHSESLTGMRLPLTQVAPTIYRRLEGDAQACPVN